MRKILLCCLLAASVLGCKPNTDAETVRSDSKALGDSIGMYIQFGMMQDDTVKLQKALSMIDEKLKVDTTSGNRQFCYYNQAMILNLLHRHDEALVSQEKMMMLLPEKNLERMSFMLMKYIREEKKDSADYFMDKTMKAIDDALSNKYDDYTAGRKSELIYLRDGKDAALEYLSNLQNEHPDNYMVDYFRDLFSEDNHDTDEEEVAEMDYFEKYIKDSYPEYREKYLKMQEK